MDRFLEPMPGFICYALTPIIPIMGSLKQVITMVHYRFQPDTPLVLA